MIHQREQGKGEHRRKKSGCGTTKNNGASSVTGQPSPVKMPVNDND
jgi:hypothetical protein